MDVNSHLKVAQWHVEQARLHTENERHKCGCPPNEHDQKAIDAVEAGLFNVKEELACAV